MPETVDEYLNHMGVVGMKWGKRSGGIKARATSIASDRNQRQTANATRVAKVANKFADAKLSKGQKVAIVGLGGTAGAAALLGRKRMAKNANKRVADLAAQRSRIESGKMSLKDKAGVFASTSTMDVFVSRRSKKGY